MKKCVKRRELGKKVSSTIANTGLRITITTRSFAYFLTRTFTNLATKQILSTLHSLCFDEKNAIFDTGKTYVSLRIYRVNDS